MDQSPVVDIMHIKDAPLLMLQPDGLPQIQSDRDLQGVAWRSSCGLSLQVYQHRAALGMSETFCTLQGLDGMKKY